MVQEHRWTIVPPPPDLKDASHESGLVARLSQEIRVPQTIAKILVHRDIDTYEKAKAFFRPTFALLHDPSLMDGMDRAVSRIQRALTDREKIVVFGDYDVDGTNGAAMLFVFFRQLGLSPTQVMVHIPDRIKEGYGISKYGIQRGKEFGATLMIAVDCGITAVEHVEYARSQGIDVIICDHHEAGGKLPDAYAVLDPLKPGDRYPFKHLCGCGVAFKLMQAVARSRGEEESVYSFIDFVALATTADIVPLVGENRTLVKLGLAQINSNPRLGLQALIESSGLSHIQRDGKLTSGHIMFVLAPRNNAVGRLGDAMRAVELLTCEDAGAARKFAQILEEENRSRQKIDQDTFLHAQALVESARGGHDVQNDDAIILHHQQWHPGVIGIVASRLVEKYYRPTIMLTTVNGVAKGSARSIPGFDIYQALKRVEDKLLQFGGHKYAAGLAVELDRIDEFRKAFNAIVKESQALLGSEELLTREIRIDAEIDFSELTPRFQRIVREFAPFGSQNRRPVFLARNVEVTGVPRIVGKNHLSFKVRQKDGGQVRQNDGRQTSANPSGEQIRQSGPVFDAIGFNLGDLRDRLTTGSGWIDLVFSVDETNQKRTDGYGMPDSGDAFPQLHVKDFRVASTEGQSRVIGTVPH